MNFRICATLGACLLAIQMYAFFGATVDFCKEIERSPAWHGTVSEKEAETLLHNQKPFTYMLRTGNEGNQFFISYVKADSSIGHVDFIFDVSAKKWFYKNSAWHYEDNINALLQYMMHCDPAACTIFVS